VAILSLQLGSLAACGPTQGSILYFLGFGRGQKVEAQFRLTKQPVLILVDDTAGAVDWPAAKNYVFDELAQELLRNKAAAKLVPRESVERLRQSMPDFDSRGAREIGESVKAEQVLWVEIGDYLGDPQISEAVVAAYFNVSVKVLNVLEKERRSRVRLWPTSPRGHLVSVTMTASEVSIAQTKDGIARALAQRLAAAIARLFYDHRLGELERAPETR
jgi:hypothetical protein